jgi:hypothetical protein
MTDVTRRRSGRLAANLFGGEDANVLVVEEECPDCGGEDIGCPFGDWSWGDIDAEDGSPTPEFLLPTSPRLT